MQRQTWTPSRTQSALFLPIGPEQRSNGGGALVSCLMVTRNRLEQAKIAVRSFRRQTWPSRELVIVDTTEADDLPRWVTSLNNSRIRVKFMPGCTDSLGDMRNVSIEEATGNYVCQWDDDDLSHPARLEVQIAAMRATEAQASFLLREMMWMPQSQRLCIARKRPHENTVLCEKAVMPA